MEKTNGETIDLSEGNIKEMLRYILTANDGTEKLVGTPVLKREKDEILVWTIVSK